MRAGGLALRQGAVAVPGLGQALGRPAWTRPGRRDFGVADSPSRLCLVVHLGPPARGARVREADSRRTDVGPESEELEALYRRVRPERDPRADCRYLRGLGRRPGLRLC